MGLTYDNLDDTTRSYMLEEFAEDLAADKLYLSPRLTQIGQGRWSDLLHSAIKHGFDDTLALTILDNELLNASEMRQTSSGVNKKRVPHDAHHTLAEGEFNRFYVRGLCRRAIAENLPRLEVYRAKEVSNPRSMSKAKVGLMMEPKIVLIDVRASIGFDTALGMPQGPNSGLTLRIPHVMPVEDNVMTDELTTSQKLDKVIIAIGDLRTQLGNVATNQSTRFSFLSGKMDAIALEVGAIKKELAALKEKGSE